MRKLIKEEMKAVSGGNYICLDICHLHKKDCIGFGIPFSQCQAEFFDCAHQCRLEG